MGRRRGALKGYSSRNRVRLVRGGSEYFTHLVQLIRDAISSIHLQIYIIDEDDTGILIMDELCKAAERGVQVYFLVDGYATQRLTKKAIGDMKDRGVHFRWFEPLLHSRHFYFGRRLHQKVCVADAAHALVGGVNISNRYNDFPGQPAWLDWATRVDGEAAEKLFVLCNELWNKSGWGKSRKIHIPFPEPKNPLPDSHCYVRVRRQDWVRFRTEISQSYLEMLEVAQEEVFMLSSYFLPGRPMRTAIAAAVKRGVKIYVVAAGKSDVGLAKQAERYLYRWLLKNKVQLYEYQSSILHGKISCADGRWATVGSFNINFISAYASIELNLEVLDKEFASQVKSQILEVIEKESVPITEREGLLQYGFGARLYQKTSYTLVRLIFVLLTFYYRQRR